MDKEYIEREAVVEKSTYMFDEVLGHCKCVLVEDVYKIPSANVVEVVRCKECACFIECTEEDDVDFPIGYGYCSHDKAVLGYLPPDHFCGYAERKDKN